MRAISQTEPRRANVRSVTVRASAAGRAARRRAQLSLISAAKGLPKHAAVVLRRGMRREEFNDVEAQLQAHNVRWTAAPARSVIASKPGPAICGLVVTGADASPTAREHEAIAATVGDCVARGVPILALSDAVDLVLDAAGLEAAPEEHRGILLCNGVQILETGDDITGAVEQMAGAPPS
jgi:hypothetical protein